MTPFVVVPLNVTVEPLAKLTTLVSVRPLMPANSVPPLKFNAPVPRAVALPTARTAVAVNCVAKALVGFAFGQEQRLRAREDQTGAAVADDRAQNRGAARIAHGERVRPAERDRVAERDRRIPANDERGRHVENDRIGNDDRNAGRQRAGGSPGKKQRVARHAHGIVVAKLKRARAQAARCR